VESIDIMPALERDWWEGAFVSSRTT
jgi:hypothetical protein